MTAARNQCVAHVISQFKTLKVVSLHENRIGDAGATALAQGIAASESLTGVYLGKNRIGDAGATALAQAIAACAEEH